MHRPLRTRAPASLRGSSPLRVHSTAPTWEHRLRSFWRIAVPRLSRSISTNSARRSSHSNSRTRRRDGVSTPSHPVCRRRATSHGPSSSPRARVADSSSTSTCSRRRYGLVRIPLASRLQDRGRRFYASSFAARSDPALRREPSWRVPSASAARSSTRESAVRRPPDASRPATRPRSRSRAHALPVRTALRMASPRVTIARAPTARTHLPPPGHRGKGRTPSDATRTPCSSIAGAASATLHREAGSQGGF